MFKTTKRHKEFWSNRQINWEQDYLLADGALNHPHRQMILDTLASLRWRSIVEVGMGAGANLVRIKQQWPSAIVGGCDINRDAVIVAGKYLKDARYLDVADPRDIFLSDGTIDVTLSDACLIYMGPTQIRKALKEMRRVAIRYLVLCEFHSESWWERMKLRWQTGYNAYDYKKLLEELGFFNIKITKIPKEVWPGTPWEKFGCIVTCEFPSR